MAIILLLSITLILMLQLQLPSLSHQVLRRSEDFKRSVRHTRKT
jgi:hypothetical protein